MRERLNSGLLFGLIGNLLFIVFAFICMIYYKSFTSSSIHSKILEGMAYLSEIIGFFALVYCDYLIITSVRLRNRMKIAFSFYIVFEAVMMILELNSYHFGFYKPYSLALAIAHSLISAAVCFSFIESDPDNKKYEILIIACTGIIFCGMLGYVLHIRIYFGILVNAFAFAILFAGIRSLTKRGEMNIEVHGERANANEYSSEFFKDE